MDFRPYELVWNYEWQALDMVRRQSCSNAASVCVWPHGDRWVLQALVSESSRQCRECGAGSSVEGAGEGLGWSTGTSLPLCFPACTGGH